MNNIKNTGRTPEERPDSCLTVAARLIFICCLHFWQLAYLPCAHAGDRSFDDALPAESSPGGDITRRIRIGGDHNYPPYEFLDAEGRPVGFHVDLINAIAQVMDIKVEFRFGPWAQQVEDIENGDIDILTMLRSPQRDESVDFSEPLSVLFYGIFMRRGSPAITDPSLLRGHEVVLQANTIIDEYLTMQDIGSRRAYAETEADALRELAAGQHDYALVTVFGGWYTIEHNHLGNLRMTGQPFLPRDYCLAVTKGNTDLLNRLNQGLAVIKSTGQYERIQRRWFRFPDPGIAGAVDFIRIAAWVLVPLALLTLAAMIWSWTLKRRIGRGTRELQAELAARRQAEQALRESQGLLQSIMDHSSAVVYIKDMQGRYRYCNRLCLELLKRDEAAVLGKTDYELFPVDIADRLRANDQQVMDANADIEFEEQFEFDGEQRTYIAMKFPMRDAAGGVEACCGISTDITARKRAEEEVRQLNETLEHRVEMRTAALAAANRELEAFTYSVSHDLRAPLRSIDGFTRALMEDQGDRLDAIGHDYLGRVLKAADNMSNLIEGLLKLSRASRQPLQVTEFSFSDLALDVIAGLRSADPAYRVETHVMPGMLMRGDQHMIRLVLENLLGNAWKFCRRVTAPMVDIGVMREDGETVYYVRDNGIGFDSGQAEHLFAPFHRFHDAREYEGTGVGLSIVQRVIVRHGGWIRAESGIGKGAAFIFTIGEAE